MVPIDSKNDRPWTSANATLVLLDIRAKAEVDLLRLDEHRSGGRLNAENGYATYSLEGDPDDPSAKYRADPVLAAMKHCGADTDKLTAKRWGEFCAKPQDEEATIARLGLHEATNAIGKMVEQGADLEAAIAAIPDAVPVPADEPEDEPEATPPPAPLQATRRVQVKK